MIPTLNLGIEIDQDADFNAIIGISSQSGAVDLTDYEFLGDIAADTNPNTPPSASFIFTVLNQVTNKGQVKMSLPALANNVGEITTSIATPLVPKRQTTRFVFDVKMKDTLGTITRIIQGVVYLSPEATQEDF